MAAALVVGVMAAGASLVGSSVAGAATKAGQVVRVTPYKNVKVKGKPSKVVARASTAMTALIDSDYVTTDDGLTDSSDNPISLEEYAAEQLGYTVTVVSGTQWDSMTAAQFAQYQLLIVGDPFCSLDPSPTADSDASTWAPVVMGTAGFGTTTGNRTIIGTDPEFHFIEGAGGATEQTPGVPTSAGAEHMVQDGISFAGAITGATGVYFDTSCADNGDDLATLDRLTSVSGGTFQDNGYGTTGTTVPCGGSVQQIASVPAFDSGPTVMTDANIQGWSCSDHITFPTYPTDFEPLAVATDTATTPTCGTDPDTDTEACGQAYILLAGSGVTVTAPNLALSPLTGSQTAGASQTHTVTATVTQSSSPLSGADVSFVVTGQNAGVSGTCTLTGGASDPSCATGSDGEVHFTYHDTNGAGADTIDASVTVASSTEHASAAWTWTAGGPAGTQTSTQLTGGGVTAADLTVASGTGVTDQATVTGTNSATASGTITYNVYKNSGCTTLATGGGGSPETITTPGTMPKSAPVTLTTAGTYYWQAVYSGDTNNAGSKSTCGSEVETVTSPTAPTCVLSAVIPGPPKQIQVTVQASAGLDSVLVTEDVNDTYSIPTFTSGDTSPLVITATKTDQSEASEFGLRVIDMAGNSVTCDPADLSLTGGPAQSLSSVPSDEHYVTITNNGLNRVVFTVDGARRDVWLGSPTGLTVVDLSSLFTEPTNNVVVKGYGTGTADVLLSD